MAGLVGIDAERARLQKAVDETAGLVAASRQKLANPQFVERAPAAVVEKERAKAAELAERLAKLAAQIEDLG
jgi:valyl-tRNA synthetase